MKQTVKLAYVIHFFWENYEAVKLCEAQVETVGLQRASHRSQVQWPNGMA